MKNLYLIILVLVAFSCTPDDYEMYDTSAQVNDIKILKLTPYYNQMIDNGKAAMHFNVRAYGIKEWNHVIYRKDYTTNTDTYRDTLKTDTFLIAKDNYPAEIIKIYDEEDNLIGAKGYMPPEGSNLSEVGFYAKCGDIVSDMTYVTINQVEPENYEEVVYPIIFHIIEEPFVAQPPYKIDTEYLQSEIDNLNSIFNGRQTKNPNVGNANIKFVLAKYDETGQLLEEEGIQRIRLSEVLNDDEKRTYLKDNSFWDPNKYLNIWFTRFQSQKSKYPNLKYPHWVNGPNSILNGQTPIPGVEDTEVDSFVKTDDTPMDDVGIIINTTRFFQNGGFRNSEVGIPGLVGVHLGLKGITANVESKLDYTTWTWTNTLILNADGDNDYCSDTPIADDYIYNRYFHTDYVTKEFYMAENIMELVSLRNSITYQQAKRIREVLAKCPSRWSYKSQWALTGKDN
jgi:hypothetical protein